jgi:hypothetical protein
MNLIYAGLIGGILIIIVTQVAINTIERISSNYKIENLVTFILLFLIVEIVVMFLFVIHVTVTGFCSLS